MKTLAELIAEEEAKDAKAAAPKSAPLSPKRKAKLDRNIAAGMSPLPGGVETALEAIKESNQAVGQRLADAPLFGVAGQVLREAGQYGDPVQPIPEPGKGDARKMEDLLPTESTLASVPAAAIDMATTGGPIGKAGQALGRVPAALARKLGVSEASTAVSPALQTAANAAGAGAVYGGGDVAMRGGDLADVAGGALEGAAGNMLMSQLPAVASGIEDRATGAVMRRATKRFLEIGQGKAANKAQLALGKGDKELGKRELQRVVREEGLEPTVRKSPASIANVVQERLEQIWENELGPIRSAALNAEPSARVPVSKIRETLRGLVGDEKRGTNFHDDVETAISLLEARAKKIGTAGQFPPRNLLKNAQEFERDGYGKTEAKFSDGDSARAIGKALRQLSDERISQIYTKHPELVRAALGRPDPGPPEPKLLETGEANPDYRPTRFGRATIPAKLDQSASEAALDLEALGGQYRAGLKRYADLKAIEPAAEQLASRASQERPGLINTMRSGGRRILGGVVGGSAGGAPGALLGAGVADVAGRLVSPAQRAAGAVASKLAGPAVDPQVAGAILARYGQQGLDAYETYLASQRAKGDE